MARKRNTFHRNTKYFTSPRKYVILNSAMKKDERAKVLMKKYRKGTAFPVGAVVTGKNQVQFTISCSGQRKYSLVLYEGRAGKREEIELDAKYQIGNLYSVIVEGIDPSRYTYNYVCDGVEFTDKYAKAICGNEVWGKNRTGSVRGGIGFPEFDWEGDEHPYLTFKESVFYQLHVRGFTKHSSSGVKKKGTFEGICEKLPYLKELGITTLELLPCYEFLEYERETAGAVAAEAGSMEFAKQNYTKPLEEAEEALKINYWGFKHAWYFAPKASYSGGEAPGISFKKLVKALHKEKMEAVMQFYFPAKVPAAYILEVVRYWVREYHIDGVRLMGVGVPITLLATDETLRNTKLLCQEIPCGEIYDSGNPPAYCNMAVYNDEYLYRVRPFLKGDIGTLKQAFDACLAETSLIGNMVYLTNYNTFTLHDLVSYERKHNEANGEQGRDGNSNNLSWNCGAEGKTKKRQVIALREKQMRNAVALLLLSRGTPVLLAGDEFGNSQNGNNNPYCQDNTVSWLNWKEIEKQKELFDFTRELIAFVKKYPMLKEMVNEDAGFPNKNFPYLSFHGKEAWKLEWDFGNEEKGGILYHGEGTYLYIGINMHWEGAELALPKLPEDFQWEVVLDTEKESKESIVEEKAVVLSPRSIKVIMAKREKDSAQ